MNFFGDMLQTPIEFLKGVGPARAALLKKELDIKVFEDLLLYFPFRHVDRSKFYRVTELQESMTLVQLKGRISGIELQGDGRKQRLTAKFSDESGTIELIWFQSIRWVQAGLKVGEEYVIFGKPALFKGHFTMAHPELDLWSEVRLKPQGLGLQPVYSVTEKLKQGRVDPRILAKFMSQLLEQCYDVLAENLPAGFLQHYKLMGRREALINIHFPANLERLEAARRRLKFEELFFLQFGMIFNKRSRQANQKGHVFEVVGTHFNQFFASNLAFELTNAQKRVVKEIRFDLKSGYQMNRLLQGDVGSGKTVVALMSMLIAADNGFQACLMAPTEILATQHFLALEGMLTGMDVKVGLLTGSTPKKQRTQLHAALRSGELHFLVGTHALIEPDVQFRNLGLTVIDEQHRFGVAQRAALWAKNSPPPHVLVMTATPIPRTLAMTLYGDLDSSVIDELPKGRKEIKTIHSTDSQRLKVFEFIRKEIALGRQVYVVYPLIEESEKLDLKDLFDGYESICRAFPLPNYKIGILHGRMKADAKQFEMERFVRGETQIMVATTVIEVGVNVPNASVMVIENAERFGLSQLHQLRGRVGRGAEQSYCILMTNAKINETAKKRVGTMCETNDGFAIAEVDLALRGPGDLAGTQQSGVMDFKIADLTTDAELLKQARAAVELVFERDPTLASSEGRHLVTGYQHQFRRHKNWSAIS